MRVLFFEPPVASSCYRALRRALERRGHDVICLERRRSERDAAPERCAAPIRAADLVVVGSNAAGAADWVLGHARSVVAFWDLSDEPSAELVRRFDVYLSSLGPVRAESFLPMVDTDEYFPADCPAESLLGYLGTYTRDRRERVEALLLEPARRLPTERFVAAVPRFAPAINWPSNVVRIEHVPRPRRRQFYTTQSFALGVTSGELANLFQAAACRTPIVTAHWEGLEAFFEPGREVFVASSADEAYEVLTRATPAERRAVAERARRRVLAEHTAGHRAAQLERLVGDLGEVAA